MRLLQKLIFVFLAFCSVAIAQSKAPSAIKIIKHYEGCALKTYKCPAGVLTIGYGNTRHAKIGKFITKEIAEIYLIEDLARFEKYADSRLTRVLPENEYSACVDLCFNSGYQLKGDFLENINRGSPEASERFKRFNKARINGKLQELRGLTARCNTRSKLYKTGSLDFEK